MLALEDLSLVVLACFAVVMLFGGLVHGTLGLGFPLVTTPLLALFLDVRSAILITLLPTACVNVVSILRGGRWGESIGRFWPLAGYAVIGSVVGTQVLIANDPHPFKLLLAALVMLYLVATRVSEFRMPWTKSHLALSMLGFGLIAGLAGGTTNVMVPILIIYCLELKLARSAMVQTFNLCFLAGKLSQIAVFGISGLLSVHLLISTAPLAAVAVLALFGGMAISDRIPTETYRRMVRHVLMVFAVLLVAQFVLEV